MPAAHLRFLVVEDHDFQRRTVARLLRDMGSSAVHEAADGRAALAVIQDPLRQVDIVISDLEMPGMDGMELIRHLGEASAKVSLVLASALDRKLIDSIATMTEAYGIKLLGIAEKPLTRAKLTALLELHRPPRAPAPPSPADLPEFGLPELSDALRRDEFEPFMQPKIDMLTQRLAGAEALARWRHPDHGIVGPHAFVSSMEHGGLIDDLTWTMLRKSARQCRAWRSAGIEATVSVNLSLRSLSEVGLADRVIEIVCSEGLDPHHMTLEVTETTATTDLAKALENLARLRVKGFGLSIDDYGTGYSSMQQLSRIAFTELKIDRAFVINASREESTQVILASSLQMARRLGILSVAEGVETLEDWQLLRKLDCDLAQGYLISRPLDAASFMTWAQGWNHLPGVVPAS